MASIAYLKFIVFSVFLLLAIKCNQGWESRRDLSSLINILGQKYSGNKRPLIVVVDTQAYKDKQPHSGESTDTSDERVAVHLSHLLQKNLHNKVKAKKLHLPKKTTTKSLIQLKQNRQKQKIQKLRADIPGGLKSKTVLRSPLIKKLLRISNNIQCEAKDECQDQCNNKYNNNKVINCEIECEVKYDCDEELEKEETDPCDDDECEQECVGSGECLTNMSTKSGLNFIEEESKNCMRC